MFVELAPTGSPAVVLTAVILNVELETFAFITEVPNTQVALPFVATEALAHNIFQLPNVPFHHLTLTLRAPVIFVTFAITVNVPVILAFATGFNIVKLVTSALAKFIEANNATKTKIPSKNTRENLFLISFQPFFE
jgi:hypothetical protein